MSYIHPCTIFFLLYLLIYIIKLFNMSITYAIIYAKSFFTRRTRANLPSADGADDTRAEDEQCRRRPSAKLCSPKLCSPGIPIPGRVKL